jgi:FkbM family methyltransferase
MRLLERTLTALPYSVTDGVLFGSHRAAGPLQVVMQRLIGGPRPATFLLDGLRFHCSTSEKYFFERENFERELGNELRRHLGPEDVVYDFGAHIGYWLLRLSRLCKHVVAFEPSPLNFGRLRQNVGDIPNVTLVNAAIAAEVGKMPFSEAGSMSTVGEGEIVVNATTLDVYARSAISPTFLLVDVEGFAGQALSGAPGLLSRRTPLICEVHHDSERQAVFGTLEDFGYHISPIDRDHSYPFRVFAA